MRREEFNWDICRSGAGMTVRDPELTLQRYLLPFFLLVGLGLLRGFPLLDKLVRQILGKEL